MEQSVSRRGFIGAAIGTGAAAAAVTDGRRSARLAASRGGRARQRPARPARHPAVHDAATDAEPGGARKVLRALGRWATPRSRQSSHLRLDRRSSSRSELAPRRPAVRLRPRRARASRPPPAGRPATARRSSTPPSSARSSPASRGSGSTPQFPYTSEAHWHELADASEHRGRDRAARVRPQFFYHNHDFEFLNRFGGRRRTTSCSGRPTAGTSSSSSTCSGSPRVARTASST